MVDIIKIVKFAYVFEKFSKGKINSIILRQLFQTLNSSNKLYKSAINYDVSLPTLWLENEDGDVYIPDFEFSDKSQPKDFLYQHSRFPNVLTHRILKFITKEEVEACKHPETKIDHDLIPGLEGRICLYCGGSQVKKIGDPWPKTWKSGGSRDFMTTESSFPSELVLAMIRPTEKERELSKQRNKDKLPPLMDFDRAVIMAANSCERCLNVLLYNYGCQDGYPEDSPEYKKSNTSCFICEPKK